MVVATNWGPPALNFDRIVNLPEAYQAGQDIGAKMQTRQGLKGGIPKLPDGTIDFAAMADIAAKAGDIETTRALATNAATSQNSAFDRKIKSDTLDLARKTFDRKEEPEEVRKVRAAGMDPTSPEGRKAMFPRTDTPVSATDKKAIFEAEDALPALQGTVENLNRALQLNDKTFTGMGAGTRAWLGSGLHDLAVPDFFADKKGSDATTEWQKIMGPEALQNMASTLKGATTDFELRKFIDMLGDPSTPVKVRASVIQRLQTLAQRKIEIQNARVRDLRGGQYFKPGGGGAQGYGAQAPAGGGDPLSAARDAINNGADRGAVIQRLQQHGIDPSGL